MVIRYNRENESTGFSSKRRAVKSELNPDPRMSDCNRPRTYKPQVMQESAVSAGGLPKAAKHDPLISAAKRRVVPLYRCNDGFSALGATFAPTT